MPVAALTPLRIPFTHSFDQRSPQRFVVASAPSMRASMPLSSSTRGVTRPCVSPTWMDLTLKSRGIVRRTQPGSYRSTPKLLPTMQPTVRPQPTTRAIVSSLIEFCAETTKPSVARYGRISTVDHSVS